MASRPEALLVMGMFGVGKSTVAADLAEVLEIVDVPYAAVDLDWLTWTNTSGPSRADEHQMMLTNLAAVVGNYLDAGATHFVLARSIRDRDELSSLVDILAMPLRTVELTLPYEEIARRLAADPTDGRRDDLARAADWMARSVGAGLAEHTVVNDRPVRDVSLEIIRWLDWPQP
jgi:adenylylsulfate kinase